MDFFWIIDLTQQQLTNDKLLFFIFYAVGKTFLKERRKHCTYLTGYTPLRTSYGYLITQVFMEWLCQRSKCQSIPNGYFVLTRA